MVPKLCYYYYFYYYYIVTSVTLVTLVTILTLALFSDKCVTGEFDKRSVRWILLLTMVVTGIAFLFVVHPTP